MRPIILAFALFFMAACGPESARQIDQASFEGQWPFSVPAGTLTCDRGSVVFTHEGTHYAVNKVAGGLGYADTKAIWSVDPKWPLIPGTTTRLVDIGDVLELGLTLC